MPWTNTSPKHQRASLLLFLSYLQHGDPEHETTELLWEELLK